MDNDLSCNSANESGLRAIDPSTECIVIRKIHFKDEFLDLFMQKNVEVPILQLQKIVPEQTFELQNKLPFRKLNISDISR